MDRNSKKSINLHVNIIFGMVSSIKPNLFQHKI